VENKASIDYTFFESRFEDLLKTLSIDNAILVKHFGDLNQDVISSLEGQVESTIIENAIPKGPLRKIFFIALKPFKTCIYMGIKMPKELNVIFLF